MRQFIALVGISIALAATAACSAHAGVKINNPSNQHHVRPVSQQVAPVR